MKNFISGTYNKIKQASTSKTGKVVGVMGITAAASLWAADYAIKNYDSPEKRELKETVDKIIAEKEAERSLIEKEQWEPMSIILMRDFKTGTFDTIIVPTRFHENFSAEKEIEAESRELKYAISRSDAVQSFGLSYVNTKAFSVRENKNGKTYSAIDDYKILSRSYFDHTSDGDDFSYLVWDPSQPGKYSQTSYDVISISPNAGNNIMIQKGLLSMMKSVFAPTANDVMEGVREKWMWVIQSSQDAFISGDSEVAEDIQNQ